MLLPILSMDLAPAGGSGSIPSPTTILSLQTPVHHLAQIGLILGILKTWHIWKSLL